MKIGHSMMDKAKIKDFLRERKGKIYFIGICGSSMSSLAEYCLSMGFSVVGSDISESSVAKLRALKIRVYSGHSRERMMIESPDMVVYSLSVSADDPELVTAVKMGIMCISRAELLGSVIDSYDLSVGVIGTHGKSTVSAMIYRIFFENGFDVGAFIGASGENIPSFCKGDGSVLVYEGCEYGDSFLHFEPTVNLVLSVDYDHTDYFASKEMYRDSFLRAAQLSRKFTVINASDPGALSMIGKISGEVVAYSENNGFDYRYSLMNHSGRYSVKIYKGDEEILSYLLSVPGEHNAKNSAAAAVLAYSLGVSPAVISVALEHFPGIGRRLERIGSIGDSPVYYDYAHHPTEIEALARSLGDMGYSKVAAVFAPHTYTRTRDFMESTALALSRFSLALITDIYGAREQPIVGVSSYALSEKICGFNTKSISVTQKEAIKVLRSADFDCLVLVGAGNLDIIKKEIEEW